MWFPPTVNSNSVIQATYRDVVPTFTFTALYDAPVRRNTSVESVIKLSTNVIF